MTVSGNFVTFDSWIDVVSEAKPLWSGETIEATDGLRLEI